MKIAIVTGGSRGLGKSAALNFAKRNIDVILTYNTRADEAREVVASIEKLGRKAVALQLDVSKSDTFTSFAASVKEVLKSKWNRDSFDFLVNNAGVGILAPIAETTEEQFDQLVNIHFKGVFFLTQKLLPIQAEGGRIINLSTGLTRFSIPGFAAYAAMKGAIEVLTRFLAKELGPRKIAVNTVAPGAIETDFADGIVRDSKEMKEFVASQTALGRVGLPGDIGALIASLCSDESGWVNAQRIEASGGMFL